MFSLLLAWVNPLKKTKNKKNSRTTGECRRRDAHVYDQNLAGVSGAILQMLLPNFKAIGKS